MKITLLYIWIEKWRCFDNAEFNFNKNYICKFDKENGVFSVEKKNALAPDNLYGENLYCNVITGNNGSGKTSLLTHILNHSFGDGVLCSDKSSYISVFLEEDHCRKKLKIFYHESLKRSGLNIPFIVECPDEIERDVITTQSNENYTFINKHITEYFVNLPIIYVTENCDINFFSNFQGQYILTPFEQLYENNEIYGGENLFTFYYYEEFEKELNFVYKYKDLLEKIKFNVPGYVNYSIHLNEIFEKENKDFYGKLVEFFTMFGSTVPSYYFSIVIIERIENDEVLEWFKKLFENQQRMKIYTKKFNSPIYVLRECLDEVSCFSILNIDYWKEIIDSLIFVNESNSNFFTRTNYCDGIIDIHDYQNLQLLVKLLNACKKVSFKNILFSVGFPLSSGEHALVNMFAKILYNDENKFNQSNKFINHSNIKCDNVFLLVDEAENALHPEWQRNFISSFTYVFSERFPETHFHIIFTTHSPIILSDFPYDNVLLLNRDYKGKTSIVSELNYSTFGSNIYDLYKNSFALEKYIGDFSYQKIKETVINLRSLIQKFSDSKASPSKEDLNSFNSCKIIYSLIGDKIIKSEIGKLIDHLKPILEEQS